MSRLSACVSAFHQTPPVTQAYLSHWYTNGEDLASVAAELSPRPTNIRLNILLILLAAICRFETAWASVKGQGSGMLSRWRKISKTLMLFEFSTYTSLQSLQSLFLSITQSRYAPPIPTYSCVKLFELTRVENEDRSPAGNAGLVSSNLCRGRQTHFKLLVEAP